jgi:hypothetical protein
MSGRIVKLEIPVHQAVQELLPWYVSGRLGTEETAKVQEHLHTCGLCQEELEWQRQLRAASPPIVDGLDVDSALAKLLPRLDEAAAPQPAEAPPAPQVDAPAHWWRRPAANEPRWLRWALAAQFTVIAGLALLLVQPDTPRYQLLGASTQASANLVVMFQPGIPESKLRRILQANGARLVDGPTVTDAYLLQVPGASRDNVLQRLRAEPDITLAEPLDGGPDGGHP